MSAPKLADALRTSPRHGRVSAGPTRTHRDQSALLVAEGRPPPRLVPSRRRHRSDRLDQRNVA